MVLPAAVGTSGSPALACPYSVKTLRGGMLPAANASESPSPAILLHMPEGLAVVAPQGVRVVSHDGEHATGAQDKRPRERPLKGHFNLTRGLSATVTLVVGSPPGEGDARVSQYGNEGLVDRVSDKDSMGPSHDLHKVESQLVLPQQAREEECRLLVEGLDKSLGPRLLLYPHLKVRVLLLHRLAWKRQLSLCRTTW